MTCASCSWQYGIRSPNPSGTLYGGFIKVLLPPSLPTLQCLYGIFASLSTSTGYFYQTFLGYSPSNGWHISAGSTNPNLGCDLTCPPYPNSQNPYRPQAGSSFELGIRIVPQGGGSNTVHLYFVGSSLVDIYTLTDNGNMSTPIGGILESYDVDNNDLNKMGGNNAFKITNANWLTQPYTSTRWTHGYVKGATPQTCSANPPYTGYTATPAGIQIYQISADNLKIGYQVGGQQYADGYTLW
jgi:hypothetical protein